MSLGQKGTGSNTRFVRTRLILQALFVFAAANACATSHESPSADSSRPDDSALARTSTRDVSAPLVQTIEPANGTVTAAAFSNDGSRLAIGTRTGAVMVFSYPDLEQNWRSTPRTGSIQQLRFSSDDRALLCSALDFSVFRVTTETGWSGGVECDEWPARWEGRFGHPPTEDGNTFHLDRSGSVYHGYREFDPPGNGTCLDTARSGTQWAVGTNARTVSWWRASGDERRDIPTIGTVTAVALHPDGDTLFVASERGHEAIHHWDGSHIYEPIAAHLIPAQLNDWVVSPDGRWIAVLGNRWQLFGPDGEVVPFWPTNAMVSRGRHGAEFYTYRWNRVTIIDCDRPGEFSEVLFPAPTSMRYGRKAPIAGPGNLILFDEQWIDPDTWSSRDLSSRLRFRYIVDTDRTADGTFAIVGSGPFFEAPGILQVFNADGTVRATRSTAHFSEVSFSPDGEKLVYTRLLPSSLFEKPSGRRVVLASATKLWPIRMRDLSTDSWHFLDQENALARLDGVLTLWDVDTLAPIQSVMPCEEFVLSDDGSRLFTTEDGKVLVHDLVTAWSRPGQSPPCDPLSPKAATIGTPR